VGSNLAIEAVLLADTMARLLSEINSAGRADPVYVAGTQRVATATGVAVNIVNLFDELPAETGISGFHRADLELDATTYIEDDKTGATLRTIAGVCRKAFSWDDILTKMNASTGTTNTYLYTATTGGTMYVEEKYRHSTVNVQMLLRPSN
jgi:hypothetical protein